MLQCLSIIYFVFIICESVNLFCSPLNYENDLYKSAEPLSKISNTRSYNANKINASENYKNVLLNCFRKLANRCNNVKLPNDTQCNAKKKSRRYYTGVGVVYQNISKQDKTLEGNDFNEISKLMISDSGSNSSLGEMSEDYNNATVDELSTATSSAKTQRFWKKFNKHSTKNSLVSDKQSSTDVSFKSETMNILNSFSASLVQSYISSSSVSENETTEKENLWNGTQQESIECDKTEKTKLNFSSTCSCSFQNFAHQHNNSNLTQQIILTTPVCDILSYLIEDEKCAMQCQRERKGRNKMKTTVKEKILVCADSEEMINEDQLERDSPELVAVRKKSLIESDLNDSIQNYVNTSKNVSDTDTDDITSQLLQLHKGLELKQNDQAVNTSLNSKVMMQNQVLTASVNNSEPFHDIANQLIPEKINEHYKEQPLEFMTSFNINDSKVESDFPSGLKNAHFWKVNHKLYNLDPNLVNFKNHTQTFYDNNVMKGIQANYVTLMNKNEVITPPKSNKEICIASNSKHVISSRKNQNLFDNNKILSKSASKGLLYNDFVNCQPYASKKRKKLLLEIQNNLSSLQALKTETKELKEQFNYLKDELLKPLLLKNQTCKFNFNRLDDMKSKNDLNTLHQLKSNELDSTTLHDKSTEKVFIKKLNVVFNDRVTTDGCQEVRILHDPVMGIPEKTNQYFVKEEKIKGIPSDFISNKSIMEDGSIQILTISEVSDDQNKSRNENNTNDHPTTCEVIYKIIENSVNPPTVNAVTGFYNETIFEKTKPAASPNSDTLCISCRTRDYLEAETISDADYSDSKVMDDMLPEHNPRLLEKAVTKVDKTADSDSSGDILEPMMNEKKVIVVTGEFETTCQTAFPRKTGDCNGNQVKVFGKYTKWEKPVSAKSKLPYVTMIARSSYSESTKDAAAEFDVSTTSMTSNYSHESESTGMETISTPNPESITILTGLPEEYTRTLDSKGENTPIDSKGDNTPNGGISDDIFSESSRVMLGNSESTEIDYKPFVTPSKTVSEKIGVMLGSSECLEMESNKAFVTISKTAETEENCRQQNSCYPIYSQTSKLIPVSETNESSETCAVTELICQKHGYKIEYAMPKTFNVKMTESTTSQEFMNTEHSDEFYVSAPVGIPKEELITTTEPNSDCKIIPVIFSIKTQIVTNVSAQVEEYNPSAKIKIINVTDTSNSSVQSSGFHSPFGICSIKSKPLCNKILTKDLKDNDNKELKLIHAMECKDHESANGFMKNLIASNTIQNRIPISLVNDIKLEPQNGYNLSNRRLKFLESEIMTNKSHAINRKSTDHTVNSSASLKPFIKDINIYHALKTTFKSSESTSKDPEKRKYGVIGKSTTKIVDKNFKTTLKSRSTSNLSNESPRNSVNPDSVKNILAKNFSNLFKNNLIHIGSLIDPLIKIPVSYLNSMKYSNESTTKKINVVSKQKQNNNLDIVDYAAILGKTNCKTKNVQEIRNQNSIDRKSVMPLLPVDSNEELNRDIKDEKKDVNLKDHIPKKYKNNFTIQISFIENSESDLKNSSTIRSNPILYYKENFNTNKVMDNRKGLKSLPSKPDKPELYESVKNKNNKKVSEIEIVGKGCYRTNFANYPSPLFQIQENYNQNQIMNNENSNLLDPVRKVNNYGQSNDSRDLNYLSFSNNISDENEDSIQGIDTFYLSSGTKPKESQSEQLNGETSSKNGSDLEDSTKTENDPDGENEDTNTYNIHITKAIDNNIALDNFKTNKIQILQPFKVSGTKSSDDISPDNGTDMPTTNSKCIKNNNKDEKNATRKFTKNKGLQPRIDKEPVLMNEVMFGNTLKISNQCKTTTTTTTVLTTKTVKPHLTVKIMSQNYTLLPNTDNCGDNIINYLHKTMNFNTFIPSEDPSHTTKLRHVSTKSFLQKLKLKNNYIKAAKPKVCQTKRLRNMHKSEENRRGGGYYNNNFPLSLNDKIFRQYISLNNQPVFSNQITLKNSSSLLNNKKLETNKLISIQSVLSKTNVNDKTKINLSDLKSKNYNSINYNNKNVIKVIPMKNGSDSYQKNFIKTLMEKNNLQLMNSNINLFNEKNRLQTDNQLNNVKNYNQILNYKKNDLTSFHKNIEPRTINVFKDNCDTDLIKIETKSVSFPKTNVKSNSFPNKTFRLKPKLNEQKSDLNFHNNFRITPKNYLLYFTRPAISNGKDKLFIDNEAKKLKLNDKLQGSSNTSRYFPNNQMYQWNRMH